MAVALRHAPILLLAGICIARWHVPSSTPPYASPLVSGDLLLFCPRGLGCALMEDEGALADDAPGRCDPKLKMECQPRLGERHRLVAFIDDNILRLIANKQWEQAASGVRSVEKYLPGVFNALFSAAGLIVPDPSISPPPIPFIEADAGMDGCDVVYMDASLTYGLGWWRSRRPCRTDRAGTR